MEKTFFEKNLKKILIVAAATVAVLSAILISVFAIKSLSATNNRILVYKKDGKSIIRIKDKERVISDSGATDFKYDEKNMRVFFKVASASSQDLYDLYYVEIKKGELISPKLIDFGVENDYSVLNGKVYYLKFNKTNNTDDGCVCDIEENKIEAFSGNVSQIIALKNSDEIFFTKMHSDCKVLYRYSEGEPKEICRDITEVYGYDDCASPHILYERKSAVNNSLTELYVAYSGSEPQMICDSAMNIMLDEYEAGGNLYFFTGTKESISWSYVIADEYEESDKLITKPKRTDFFSLFGVSAEYNEKLRQYHDKLVRDEIREALNENMETGAFDAPAFTLFAFNENGTFTVAENVSPSRVYSVSRFGEPKIVYESTSVTAGDTDMAALVAIAQRSTMDEVIDYAKSVVNNSVKSNGMALAVCGKTGCVSYPLDEYSSKGTMFSFSADGSRLFAFVKGSQTERMSLYTNSLDISLKPSNGVALSSDVSAYRFDDDMLIYMKSDMNQSGGDVFTYDGNENKKLSNNAGAFILDGEDNIIVLKNYKSAAENSTVDLYLCNNGEETLISKDVIEQEYIFDKDGHAAYICSDGSGGRVLFTCCNGKITQINSNVSEIIIFA